MTNDDVMQDDISNILPPVDQVWSTVMGRYTTHTHTHTNYQINEDTNKPIRYTVQSCHCTV